MGFEPANVINGAISYDKTHALQTIAWPGRAVPTAGRPAAVNVRGAGDTGGKVGAGGQWAGPAAVLGQNGYMPRSNRPRRPVSGRGPVAGKGAARKRNGDVPELDLERARAGIARRESAPDGEWMIRTMTAKNAEKTYICPECSTAVLPGVAHLVVWKDDHLFGAAAGLAERRHWHTNCWMTRSYRYR